jgi:transposase-like protein
MTDVFSAPQFTNDEAARKYLEGILWPEGPVCAHCGTIGKAYATKRAGVYRCAEAECRKDFTVTMKTVMERSHIALHKWLQGFALMTASKKGVSAHQLHRTLGITYRSAWFMAHRIREAMRAGGMEPPLGGGGRIVEADETYHGPTGESRVSPQRKGRPYRFNTGPRNKRAIVSLVERGGRVRTFHVAVADKETVQNIVRENISRESRLHTDESRLYWGADEHFDGHETVKHTAKEYARTAHYFDKDGRHQKERVHTNSAEGYFAIFKRGMKGVYQHCGEKHLHRYLAEYDFRYNHREKLGYNDRERAARAVQNAAGKRLTYRQPH